MPDKTSCKESQQWIDRLNNLMEDATLNEEAKKQVFEFIREIREKHSLNDGCKICKP